MFKVKATVVAILGDPISYPCHFDYKIGSEIIWTGANFIGRICPAILVQLSQKVSDLYSAGPRHVDPSYYYPFWYCSPSAVDPTKKKYDGIGFKPVLKTIKEPKMSMANLVPQGAFVWPPQSERTINKGISFVCPDGRTSIAFALEAFDLAEDGDCVCYFRRQMVILSRLQKKTAVPMEKILDEFTKKEIEEIHPPLSLIMVRVLVEELDLLGFVTIKNDKVTVTPKGKKKLAEFVGKLSAEEKKALKV
jgi:hypothetical protein